MIHKAGAIILNPRFYKSFSAPTHDDKDIVTVNAYFVDVDGNMQPGEEIEEMLWVDRNNHTKYNLGRVLRQIIPELINEGVL